MKRQIALFTALLLVLGCVSPALAAEEAPGLYQQYGPWGEWTQEQKDAAEENWTEAQWSDYWAEYDTQVWNAVWQYDEDYDLWSYDHFEQEDTWGDYLRAEKEELGMPYPDGINVSLNGSYLDFGGTPPLAVSGRTMVPFRAFLEGLGAQVDYDDGHITALLADGDSLEMELGQTELIRTEDGKITALEMDTAPFVRDGHTYIPVRAAAEALGLDVYWDESYEAAHLTDYAALTAELDQRFTAANELWTALLESGRQEPGKSYQTAWEMKLSATLYGEKTHGTASLTAEMEQLTRDGSYRMEQGMRVDLGGMEDTLFSMLSEEELARLEAFNNSRSITLYDRESGTLYQKGAQPGMLTGEALPDDVWTSTQVGELSPADELALPETLGELLVQMYGYSWYYYRLSPWETVMESALPVRLLLDDDNFTRRTSGGRTTYVWKVDLPTLAKRAGSLGVLETLTATGELSSLNLEGEAALRDGALEKLTGSGQAELGMLGIPATAGITLDADPGQLTLEMNLTGAYIGKVELSVRGTTAETSEVPVTTPPEGETVERLEVLTGQVEPGVPADFGAACYVQCLLDTHFGRGCDPDFLAALGETEESLSTRQTEENVDWLCFELLIDYPSEETRTELAALAGELFAKVDYTVGVATPVEDGSAVEVTVRPLDVLARFNEDLWTRLEEFDAAYTGDITTDEGYRAYDAAWAEEAVALFREKLAEAEYLPETSCTVTVLNGPGDTLEADSFSLSMVYETIFPSWILEE